MGTFFVVAAVLFTMLGDALAETHTATMQPPVGSNLTMPYRLKPALTSEPLPAAPGVPQ